MKEYEAEVLEQYDMEVKSTRKIRGAFFCDTSEGTMLLKETHISERRAFLVYTVLSRLELERNLRVDTPVFTREGGLLVTSREGKRYMLKRWYTGRECDMKREAEIVSAAESLALLHEQMQCGASEGGVSGLSLCPPAGRDPIEEMARHNRERKKVRSFIRTRVAKMSLSICIWRALTRCTGSQRKWCAGSGRQTPPRCTEGALRKEGLYTAIIIITMC